MVQHDERLILDDINCSNCGGPMRGEANCSECGQEKIYGEEVAQFLEHHNFLVDPTHRTEDSFREWYIQSAKDNSKFYKANNNLIKFSDGLTNVGKEVGQVGSGITKGVFGFIGIAVLLIILLILLF